MTKILFFLSIFFVNIGVSFTQNRYAAEPDWFRTYDVKFYSINLEVNDTTTFLKGYTLIKIEIKESTDSIVFNFNPGLTIDSILLDKQKVDVYKYITDYLVIKPGNRLALNTTYDVKIYYQGDVVTGTFFSSVTSEKDSYWNIPVTWTLSEPFGAKNWFPCKQQLSDKADSCWVFLTIPKGRKAGSVGILSDTINGEGNKVQYQWKTKYPIAFYLISFSVSDYKDYSFYTKIGKGNDSILVQNYYYNRPQYLQANKEDIDRTKDFLKVFSEKFGIYPFYKEKYGHCVAPIGGGMEHQTMTTLNNFGYSLVSHELAHQWFGDYVTCASWQDIWINEGFASYGEYIAYEFLEEKELADSWMLNAQNRALREPDGSVFIPASEAQEEYRIFSSNLSYKKGAVILHMLRHKINNDSLFFKALRSYLDEYKFNTATGDDFKKSVEAVTNLDLTTFFNEWYYGKGFPTFDISWKLSNDTLALNVNQTPSSSGTSFFSVPFEIRAAGFNMDTIIRLEQVYSPQLYTIKLSNTISNIEFDPSNWLLKKVSNITRLPEIPSNDDYFKISPNPFEESLKIFFKVESAKDEKIQIVGVNGNLVFETFVRKKKEVTINTSEIMPGIYLLIVSHGREKYVRKIFKA